jgi:hypothetical protein
MTENDHGIRIVYDADVVSSRLSEYLLGLFKLAIDVCGLQFDISEGRLCEKRVGIEYAQT